MHVLVVEFCIRTEFINRFEAAIADNARLSLETEPGCRQFDVCRDPADPAVFLLYELYDDDAAVQAHLQAAHFRQMDTLTAAWVESKQVRRWVRVFP